MRQTITHSDLPAMEVLACPIRIDGQRLSARRDPYLAEDSAGNLAENGFSEDEVAAFKTKGVV